MNRLIILCSALLCVLSCEHITEVQDISSETIEILAPKDGSNVETNTVNFAWEALEDAKDYKLQIAQPSFADAANIEEDSIVTVTNLSITLQPGNYEWRVRAQNSEYQTSFVSSGFAVTGEDIVDISKENVVLSIPKDNETFKTNETINFSWQAVEDATEYTIQVATPNFDNPTETLKDETTAATSFSIDKLAEGDYEWRVKAGNDVYDTEYTTQDFVVEAN